MRDPGKKIPPLRFNSYQWHVFHKFTSVQAKSSYKASWKGRKYFQRHWFYYFTSDTALFWHQCSDLGTFLSDCYFHLQIEIRENWRSHVIIKNVSDFIEIISAKLREGVSKTSEIPQLSWRDSARVCLGAVLPTEKGQQPLVATWATGSQGCASSALLLLCSGCEHGQQLRAEVVKQIRVSLVPLVTTTPQRALCHGQAAGSLLKGRKPSYRKVSFRGSLGNLNRFLSLTTCFCLVDFNSFQCNTSLHEWSIRCRPLF